MENGDSAHSEHTHRSSNNAGHDFVHGTWTVQFLRKPHPRPLPKKGGAFLFLGVYARRLEKHEGGS